MEGSDVEIGAAVADQPSPRQACDEGQPDVVLPDIRMPPTHIGEVAARRRSLTQGEAAARQRRDQPGRV